MTCAYAVLKGLGVGLAAGLAAFAFIVVFGYQRPAKIAGFHNRRMRGAALGVAWGIFWGMFLAMLSGPCVTYTDAMDVAVLAWIIVPTILIGVWAIYWNIPLFRQKTGIKVVDETVERYRKPGEKAYVGHPRVVDVDGTRYVPVVYRHGPEGEVAAILAVREDTGEVVKDAALMERLGRCIRVGDEMAGWPALYRRLNGYKETKKALRAWPRALEEVQGLVKALEGTPYEEEAKALLAGWEVSREYSQRLMAMWEEEGAWAAAHGWEHMKEVRCEDLEPLDERLRGAYLYFREHLKEMKRALAAKERLVQAWAAQALPLEGEPRKVFWKALELMGMMAETVHLWEEWPTDKPFRRFLWTEEQRRQWEERLAWGARRRPEEVRAQVRRRRPVRFLAWTAAVVGGGVALLSLLAGPWWGGVLAGGALALLGWHFHEWEPKERSENARHADKGE